MPLTETRYARWLKWLMLLRVVFTTLLMGVLLLLQLRHIYVSFSSAIVFMYGIIAGLYSLTAIYALIFRYIRRLKLFTGIQLSIDIVLVSLIVFITGGFSSTLTFLYLVVIITASMLLGTRDCVLVAAWAGIQYGVLVNLEYYGIVRPPLMLGNPTADTFDWIHVLFKVVSIQTACFLVAWLSSLLAIQLRRSRLELATMQEHLKRAEKMAAVGSLAAGLAHEIKNPLASMSGSIQMLKEDLDSNSAQSHLMNIVLRETDRLNVLLSDFLLFARPPDTRRQIIDAAACLEEIGALFEKHLQGYQNVTLSMRLIPGVAIQVDARHLHQIMWNLLLNAAEAVGENGEIELKMDKPREATLTVMISDTGCGISEETLKNIFNPFFSTKPRGSGLGLSIVHNLVESNNGRLNIVSEPGNGTQVMLTLRRAPAQ